MVLLIVVDQLRGDMPLRFNDRFGPRGMRYLLDHGVHYTQAHYRHSITFTGSGHATLVTGGHAAQHGIAGNDWYDTASRSPVYCVEDDRHHLLGREPVLHQGTSPRNLTATTIGDALVMATNRQSRVFAVSLKDRGAIVPGGHLGKAFWFDHASGDFVTSTFYYDEYPRWVTKFNEARHVDRFREQAWDLLNERSTYMFADRDDRPFERSYKQLGRTFPHPLQADKPADYYATLRCTPMGDELTVDFALELLAQEQLGTGVTTDMLCISLSATDYIGHAFGPNSLEAEDNLMRLDRSLARLFAAVDRAVGLDQTLIVLSSDHGVSAIPEHMQSFGFAAGRLTSTELLRDLNGYLQERFQTEKKLVPAVAPPNIYLDPQAIVELKLDVATVERLVAERVLEKDGYSYALTRTELLQGARARDPIVAKVQRSFHPRRSGHVMVVQSVSWFLYSSDTYSAMHGSPYPYDTHVPIIFAGPGVAAANVDRQVGAQDVAPTIAALLSIEYPTGCTGTPLREVLP
jgi:predicted AlkP superfamily pyrophosphatase or phosphodiesterase